MSKPALIASLLAVVALCAPGCNFLKKTVAPSAVNGNRYYAVTAEQAPFFKRGPQQGRQPDESLTRDTLVKLIRPSFGYSKVQLVATGEQGYVSSEDIKVAPASVVLAAMATPTPAPIMASAKTPRFDLNSSDPRFAPPPEQLPAPDLPADLPAETSPPSP